MVLTKKRLNELCLDYELVARPSTIYQEYLMRNYFKTSDEDTFNDSNVDHAIPPVQEIERRPTVEEMRMRVCRHVKKRLVHSPEDIHDPVAGRSTYLYLDPQPETGQVGLAGFDIRCGEMIAESDKVIPSFGGPSEAMIEFIKMRPRQLSFNEEFVLDYDPYGRKVYYILSHEGVLFSENLEFLVDSKSTTGRVGAISHICGFDLDGKLITMVRPLAFPLKIRGGVSFLSQAVVRYKGTPYLQTNEVLESGEVKFYGDDVDIRNFLDHRGLLMRFDLRKIYRAKKCDEPIDMDAKSSLDPNKYFDLIEGYREFDFDENILYLPGSLGMLDNGAVCGILSKHEGVLTGIQSLGNLAGVIQPFFRGGITMEYYGHVKTRISTFDPAGYIQFDKLDGEFNRPESYGGSYQNQKAPRLPKMFKEI
jgi:deoxycytidine triphosphate deaminase